MSDNVPITAGTGTSIATDDVGAVHYQRVKLADGTADSSTAIAAGNGTAATALRVTVASDSTGVIGVTDNSGSLTVDNAGTFPVQVDNTVTVGGTLTIDNAGTFVVQENGALLTSAQLIDDIVYTDDTSTHATGTSKGALMMAAAVPTDTSVSANDIGAIAMTTDRKLHVSVQDALPAGTNNIGDVDVLTVPTDPFGVNADAGSATGSISAKLRFIAATGIPITGTVTVGSHAVTNAGTFVVQENGAALTSLQLIDDTVYTDDTSTHATGTSKGLLLMAAATPTDTAVNANDIGALAMTVNRELNVSLTTAIPAGTNGIGKLTANTGVTIGAVEIAAAQTLATVTTVGTVTTLTGSGVAHDAADSGNPHKVGYKAANAFPTAVANADRTDAIGDLFGRGLTAHIPPEMHKTVNKTFTSQQTGSTLIDPTSGKKLAIISVVLGSYGTTAGRCHIWIGANGDTTFSQDTDQVVTACSFAPSATVTPGMVYCPSIPDFVQTADHELHITTSAALSIDVTVKYYEW